MLPHELYFRKKPILGHLRVFDNITYVHVPKEKWRKLDIKVEKCILVDYSSEQKGLNVITPGRNRHKLDMMSYSMNWSLGIYLRPIRPHSTLLRILKMRLVRPTSWKKKSAF